MTLPAIPPRGMLHPNGRHRTRAHMTGDTIASHLKFMRDGRRSPGQFGSTQAGCCNAAPVDVNEQFLAGHFDMTLPAGLLFRMGRDGCVSFKFLRPTAPGMTGKTLNPG